MFITLAFVSADAMWQMNLSANEGMEPGSYPERPGVQDCTYYLRTGLCKFGMTCRFNHPPNRKLVMNLHCTLTCRCILYFLCQPACCRLLLFFFHIGYYLLCSVRYMSCNMTSLCSAPFFKKHLFARDCNMLIFLDLFVVKLIFSPFFNFKCIVLFLTIQRPLLLQK